MNTQNEIFYYFLGKHLTKYLRATYNVDTFPNPFYDVWIFTGQYKLDEPLEITRDITFGTAFSDIIPTELHIPYIISKDLLNLLNEQHFTGFVSYALISDDGFLNDKFSGISITGRMTVSGEQIFRDDSDFALPVVDQLAMISPTYLSLRAYDFLMERKNKLPTINLEKSEILSHLVVAYQGPFRRA